MNHRWLIALFAFLPMTLFSQGIYLEYLYTSLLNISEKPIPEEVQGEYIEQVHWLLGYEHRLKDDWYVSIDYTNYFNIPVFAVVEKSYDRNGFGDGFSRTHLLGLGVKRSFRDHLKRWTISPGLYLRAVYIQRTSSDFECIQLTTHEHGDDFIGCIDTHAYPGFKPPLVELRLPVEFRIWRGWRVYFKLGWTLGFKRFQDISYHWTYVGSTEHHDLTHYINGTGITSGLGLKVNF